MTAAELKTGSGGVTYSPPVGDPRFEKGLCEEFVYHAAVAVEKRALMGGDIGFSFADQLYKARVTETMTPEILCAGFVEACRAQKAELNVSVDRLLGFLGEIDREAVKSEALKGPPQND